MPKASKHKNVGTGKRMRPPKKRSALMPRFLRRFLALTDEETLKGLIRRAKLTYKLIFVVVCGTFPLVHISAMTIGITRPDLTLVPLDLGLLVYALIHHRLIEKEMDS